MTSTPIQRASRGEVWLVEFDPAVGAEIRKRRPALVVTSPGVGRLALEIVVPLTDWKGFYDSYAWFVQIPATAANGLNKDSGADAFQVKSISQERFVRHLGAVTPQQLQDVVAAIALSVGFP